MKKDHEITIRFPDNKSLMAFATWLCDGGGEQDFCESTGIHCPENAIGRLQYHLENESFTTDDKRRYGKFMADKLIIAHPKEAEEL